MTEELKGTFFLERRKETIFLSRRTLNFLRQLLLKSSVLSFYLLPSFFVIVLFSFVSGFSFGCFESEYWEQVGGQSQKRKGENFEYLLTSSILSYNFYDDYYYYF